MISNEQKLLEQIKSLQEYKTVKDTEEIESTIFDLINKLDEERMLPIKNILDEDNIKYIKKVINNGVIICYRFSIKNKIIIDMNYIEGSFNNFNIHILEDKNEKNIIIKKNEINVIETSNSLELNQQIEKIFSFTTDNDDLSIGDYRLIKYEENHINLIPIFKVCAIKSKLKSNFIYFNKDLGINNNFEIDKEDYDLHSDLILYEYTNSSDFINKTLFEVKTILPLLNDYLLENFTLWEHINKNAKQYRKVMHL